MQQYTLDNGARKTRFNGTLLAQATSRGHSVPLDALRWTEVSVYSTEAGTYVLHKVGKSRVYHETPYCSKSAVGTDPMDDELLPDEQLDALEPCPLCWTEKDLTSLDEVWVEADKGSVLLSDTAQGLVENAYNRDADGALFVPKVTRYVLDRLSETDPAVAEAWQVEEVA